MVSMVVDGLLSLRPSPAGATVAQRGRTRVKRRAADLEIQQAADATGNATRVSAAAAGR